MKPVTPSFGRSLWTLLVLAVTAGAGCTSSYTAETALWSARAEQVARARLASGSPSAEAPAGDVSQPSSSGLSWSLATPSSGHDASRETPLSAPASDDEGDASWSAAEFALTASSDPEEASASPPTAVASAVSMAQAEEEESASAGTVDRGPLPGLGETLKRDLKELPSVLWDDTKAVYTDPWNLI